MSLKAIKNKIRSVNKTHKVTKAMEAVSAVKMRKSQERALIARPYATSALTILSRVSKSIDAAQHPLTMKKEGNRTAYLLVTSDKGLAGSLNSAVLKKCVSGMQAMNSDTDNTTFLCIGNKGYEYFKKRGYEIQKHYDNLGDQVLSEDMKEVTNTIIELFLEDKIDRAYVAYTNFKSTFEQTAELKQILPISLEEVESIIRGIVPEKGKDADLDEDIDSKTVYEIEPDPEEVFNELMPFLVNIELYHTLLESKASEHSARMVAMKNASDKAEEMSGDLSREFNRARQAMITREVSEIIGGMEVMK